MKRIIKIDDITLKFDEIKLYIKCQKSSECSMGLDEKCNSCGQE